MKKQLLTLASIALMSSSVAFAQDPSAWKSGQDVTAELQWQELTAATYVAGSGVWQTSAGTGLGHFYDTSKCSVGSWELYNNQPGSDFYQVFWMPAGVYTFYVQGLYRPSSAWSAGWDTNPDRLAEFYCDAVSVDEETMEITGVERENNVKVAHIVSDPSDYKVLTDEMCGDWQRDNQLNKDGGVYWVPNSMWGTSLHFELGKYQNELRVINTRDGYVKVGLRKTGWNDSDWLIFDNFRASYESDAGEAVQLEIAQADLELAVKKAQDLSDEIRPFYGSLAGLLDDAIMEIDSDNGTVEACQQGIDALSSLIEEYKQYYEDAKGLTTLVAKCAVLANSVDDATFKAAVDAAKAVEEDGTGDSEMTIDSPKAYGDAAAALAEARVKFLTSQEAVDGAVDFTSMINYPWFCNEEYNPTYNAGEGRWYFPDYVLNGDGELEGFGSVGESADTYKPGTGKVVVSDNVKIGLKEVEGQWYQVGTSAYEPYFNHQYTSAKQWAVPGGNREICQIITDLPDGYYAAKGLGMTWGNDWDKAGLDETKTCHMGIYIESSEGRDTSKEEPIYSGWWQGWHPFDWVQYTTNMVRVTDGKVKVAFFANGFSSFTGMQLFYYGENPDFTAMLKPELDAVKSINLRLKGDKAYVESQLAEVPATINNYEEYAAARETVAAISAYAKASESFTNNYNLDTQVGDKQDAYGEGTAEYAMLDPLWEVAFDFIDSEGATYKDGEQLYKDFDSYLSYFATVKKMEDTAAGNAELKAIIDRQESEIKDGVKTTAQIEEYIAELAAPYNAAVIAELNGDKATEDAPIDVTKLLVNPEFNEGSTGWTGNNVTVDGNLKNAESYNTGSFRYEQTVRNLPAGTYRVQVQSFYRDGGDANVAFENLYYQETYNEHANVNLFANTVAAPIVSIASEEFTEPSMTERIKEWVEDPEATEKWYDEHPDEPDGHKEYKPVYEYLDLANPAFPFDQLVLDAEDLWYPNSMEGSMNRFEKSPKAYINEVEVYLSETGNLTLGIAKETGIGGDWCIFDNFKLFYLGPNAATAIKGTAAEASAVEGIYNISGIKVPAYQKGINIVKMANGATRKVYVK